MADPSWLSPDVRAGWQRWQLRHGLTPDGLPGAATLAAVEALEATRDTIPPPAEPAPLGDVPAGGRWSYGGPEIRRGVRRHPAELLPWFADLVELVFRDLRAEGYDPLLWEAFRTRERAAQLATPRGGRPATGIVDSVHCYGGAVDIVDGSDSTPWSDVPEGYWAALQAAAERHGLHVLYNSKGRRIDFPHVQCVRQGKEQNRFRRATDAERLAWPSRA